VAVGTTALLTFQPEREPQGSLFFVDLTNGLSSQFFSLHFSHSIDTVELHKNNAPVCAMKQLFELYRFDATTAIGLLFRQFFPYQFQNLERSGGWLRQVSSVYNSSWRPTSCVN